MAELPAPEKILKKIGIAILCVVLVIYTAKQLTSLVNSDIKAELALAVTSDKALELDGYIIREEAILQGRNNGVMLASVRDGERIPKGKEAVRVYFNERDLTIEEEIRELEEKIDILDKSIMDTSYVSADMDKMDEEIRELIQGSSIYSADNDLVGAVSNLDNLLVRMNKRWLITNPGNAFEKKRDELLAQRDSLKKSLSGNSEGIYTDKSGYYYAKCDGYENVFSPKSVENISVNDFIEKTKASPESFSVRPAGKLVTDYKWYVGCIVSEEQAMMFDVGNTYDIEFVYNYGSVLEMTLSSRIVENNNDNAVLIFESAQIPESFEFTRCQKIKVIYESYSGLKVPKDAIRFVNDVKGVYVISGTQLEFKRAEEIYSLDGYYIIEQDPESDKYAKKYVRSTTITDEGKEKHTYYRTLSLYDQVVTEGRNLYDGMKVE